jgi:hypothetical protein
MCKLRFDFPTQLTINGDERGVGDVTYRLSTVLESPMDTLFNSLRDGNSYSKTDQDDKDEANCELLVLTCKNKALVDALPF